MLSSILRQNPRIYSNISDTLANVLRASIETSVSFPGMNIRVSLETRKSIARHLIEAYHEGEEYNKPVIFNTNLAWTHLLDVISDIHPESKMIACVRDIPWIIDSFEQVHRKNPFNHSNITGGLSNNVYERSDELMKTNGPIGFGYVGMRQAMYGPNKHKIMIVEYEQLCKNPKGMLQAIYNFIGEEYFDHDFNNVEADWDEYDSLVGMPYHRVSKKVEFKQREFILPPDIVQRYSNMEFWRM
jgi:sulfotransferase